MIKKRIVGLHIFSYEFLYLVCSLVYYNTVLYAEKIHVNNKSKIIKENETIKAGLLVVFIYKI